MAELTCKRERWGCGCLVVAVYLAVMAALLRWMF